MAPSELSRLALSLTKEVSGEEEEAESRDMAEAEGELDSSQLEVLSEAPVGVLGAAVLTSAATFCCGGQEAASKLQLSDETEKSSMKSQTAGANHHPSERWFGFFCSFSLLQFSPCSLFAFSASEVLSWESWESDVRAAAGSAVFRKEKGRGRPSAGGGQNLNQKGCLACPFTRQVQ